MRFLNFKLTSPETSGIKIEFTDGLNIISVKDNELFTLLKYILSSAICGSEEEEFTSTKNISCSVSIFTESEENEISFINDGGNIVICNTPALINDEEEITSLNNINKLFSFPDFYAFSCFSPEHIQKGQDTVFNSSQLKELLVKNELLIADIPFFHTRERSLLNAEKELTNLNRERQLLELKKMKRDKLVREISQSEKHFNKLEKKRESLLAYKMALRDINSKIESKNRLSLKINNLKKDLLELREIKNKINSVEKTLREKFSHFADKDNEQLPDLEQIQKAFNAFRDINEQLDMFFLSKKKYSDWALRIITSIAIFALTALFFMLFTTSASNILGITAATAGTTALITGLFYFIRLKKFQPIDLLESKKNMETDLIDLLKKNHFTVDGYKTGEIYEVLFQYFEDFISYRDINHELQELKKKISNSSGIQDKEKKLEQLTTDLKKIDREINETVNTLDSSIHSRPEIENITETIHDIDELLAENDAETNQKKTLVLKFREDIEEYDRIENTAQSIESRLDEVLNLIAESRERMDHIRFIENVFKKSTESWSINMLKELSERSLHYFLSLTGNHFIKEEIAATIDDILLNSARIKSEHRGLRKYISISIKAALSDILSTANSAPFLMIDPFSGDTEFTDNIKNLLPDIFSARQVLIIVPGTAPEISGNIITI